MSVRYVYKGKDVILWLPAGFGKSLCYEVTPFVFDVMQCSVALDSLTAEVHQIICYSFQASTLVQTCFGRPSFSVMQLATSSRSVNREASFCFTAEQLKREAACLVGIAAENT